MVRIAIAGGSGNVASEIIDVLVATQKHDIIILTRKATPTEKTEDGVCWRTVDYQNPTQLAESLKGVHTVLSFIGEPEDPTSPVQKALIDACVQAGVKRFAPSEWSTSGLNHLSWYAYKGTTREYLKALNKDKKVLEYCLFQPGLFTNYLTHPYPSSKHIHSMQLPIDLANRRALIMHGADSSPVTLTTSQDLAHIVALAIDHPDPWPTIGGMQGSTLTYSEIIALGEKVRGEGAFEVERIGKGELESGGEWKSGWVPRLDHPSIPEEQVGAMSRVIAAGFMLAAEEGAYATSGEWNEIFGGYEFTRAEGFLEEAWKGKE